MSHLAIKVTEDIENVGETDLGDLGTNPNARAVDSAKRVALLIAAAGYPRRIVPMADGGIGLVYDGFRVSCNNEWEDGVELHLEGEG